MTTTTESVPTPECGACTADMFLDQNAEYDWGYRCESCDAFELVARTCAPAPNEAAASNTPAEQGARLATAVLKSHLDAGDLESFVAKAPNTVAAVVVWADAYWRARDSIDAAAAAGESRDYDRTYGVPEPIDITEETEHGSGRQG